MPATSPAAARAAADRCPGVLRLAEAADGYLARIRLPGGLIGAGPMRALARLAGELGDGRVELTSRGNVQLRGLTADAAGPLTDELARAGLFPSPGHDRVRNVLASPLAGLDGGPDLTAIVRGLDAGLCARARLAELPGRFLFAVDDGRGDVAGLGADVVAQVQADGAVVNGLAVRGAAQESRWQGSGWHGSRGRGGRGDRDARVRRGVPRPTGRRGRHGLADQRPGRRGRARPRRRRRAPRAGRRPAGAERVAWRTCRPAGGGRRACRAAARPVGVVGPGGTAAVLLAPLGRLTAAQLTWLADRVGGRPARITPWRSVVLPDLPDAAGVLRDAAGLGFGVDAGSPWLRVTACAGRPGCASALADVQADAAGFAARWPDRIVHVSGCARHCGRPAATQVDVTATSEGYQVAGI